MQRLAIEKLKKWKREWFRKPLIIRGARQVGKTWILKEFGEKDFRETHYLNFEEDSKLEKIFEENLNPERIIHELRYYLDKQIDINEDLLILDEIQRCPKALTSLKYFYEKMPELAICAAGSLLGVFLNWDSFPVGKVTFLDLYPMTFEEFLLGTEREDYVDLLNNHDWAESLPAMAHDKLWEFWKHYLITGGLPEVLEQYRQKKDNLYETFQKTTIIQKDLIETYIADIAKHSGKTNAMHIERLWRNVPAQLARSLDASSSKFVFKDAVPGYRGYDRLAAPIDWLEKADLLLKTYLMDTVAPPIGAYIIENRFKLYHFDVGLLNTMNELSPKLILDYNFGSYKGYIAENFIAQEIRALGNKKLYCWEGRTSEIEFLLEVDGFPVPIEVKSGKITKSKSLKVFEERYSPRQSIIFSGKNVNISGEREYYPIYAAGWVLKKLIENRKISTNYPSNL